MAAGALSWLMAQRQTNLETARYLGSQAEREQDASMLGGLMAAMVCTSVHEAYCAQHFEESILGKA